MSELKRRISSRLAALPGRQHGAMTMFSAVLILILLTELVLYASQVGIFEQRKSANDLRQKQAFHAAEAGLQNAKEYFLANVQLLSYPEAGGWLNGDTQRWQLCSNANFADASHPCSGEAFPRDADLWAAISGGTYFYNYSDPLNAQDDDTLLPVDTDADPDLLDQLAPLGERVEVQALLCVLDINRAIDPAEGPVIEGCLQAGEIPDDEHIYFMLTLLAKGQAGCADPDDPTSCEAKALVAERLGSFGPAAGDGGPDIPLTARSSFPPSGTAELVPNPNGGGPGVPISAWLNGNVGGECPGLETPFEGGGSWTSCERHEWYGVDTMPDDYRCPVSSCDCAADERRLSYVDGGEQVVGIDIVIDDNFPCDLFQTTFGVESTLESFNELKASIGTEIDDCDLLTEDSSGVYWYTGAEECKVGRAATVEGGRKRVGSEEFPVFLVSTNDTTLVGNLDFFGLVFTTDVLGNPATLTAEGGAVVYGAMVADIDTEIKYVGNFDLVYIDSIVNLASQSGGIGKVTGGWTDAHPDWRGRVDAAPPAEEG